MRTYPWTSKNKLAQELTEALKEVKDPSKCTQIIDIDDWFDQIRNRRIPWYEKIWYSLERNFYEASWNIYNWFNPCHKPVRNAIPKRWCDAPELVLLVNFAIIKEFVEEEMDSVVWDDETRPEPFAAGIWLKSSYEYITKERAILENQHDEALNDASNMSKNERNLLTYQERYGKANEIEAEIALQDQNVLIGLAKYRVWLWS